MAAGADCGSVARLDSSRGLPQPRRYFPVAARALAHIAVAVVRAPNEAAARKAAAGAFDVPTHFPPRGGAKISALAQPGAGHGADRGIALRRQGPDRNPRSSVLTAEASALALW
jgi:hypothetical protein